MIETQLHDDVLEIVMINPPVNALGEGVRTGLDEAITGALEDDAVKAIVIRGSGRLFSGGADITEFSKPPSGPSLPAIIDAIEASSKPVVAAIHGMALGGGLEVALGSHYRVATPKAKLGLPEVTLGILPGAGGTQRLPRLVGVEAALDIITSGTPITGAEAAELGLVDKLSAEETLVEDVIAFARTLDAPRRTGDRSISADPAVFTKFEADNARRFKDLEAPRACIEAIKAAVEMPLDAGQEKERALFMQLVKGDQSKALRHVFFAERAAAKIDGLPKDTQLRPVTKVGVIGAGTMGGGISMNFLSAGIPVTIVEMAQEALDRGTDIIRKNYEATAAKGRLTAEAVERAMNLLSPTLDFDVLKDCDLIIEAVYENMDVKKEIFARLDSIAKPGAMLASNTSFLSIDEIASVTKRPQDVLGLHFFSPANVMKLVEVVRGAKTAPDVLATGMDIARKIGKVPVVAGVCYGFIGNRMLIPRQTNANALLLEGATPEQIDRVHTGFGMAMGPFQMNDLAGVDIGWHRDANRIETLQDALCAEGRWGQKKQAGFYDYDDKRRPTPSPVVDRIIEDFRAQAGITSRTISDEEITVRTFYTMVNEGAKILEEGIAQRASDIDVVWTYGYGWPRHTGGPMFWADQIGLATVVDALKRYEDRLGEGVTLSPLLLARAAEGKPLDR
ncbi:3-hydroxyacyl-CoA dehydrogenase NAD-binding domain-containing protein [Sphingobium yanoikuyae]|jgi:3-hydroxyacyl-CoA dehydrogenase|uniref:Enoyl-CoA hydratase/isomerase family protein n=1 Tax=Sphingobium yanoikuyae TaxID=13690 RepID=A0A9X7UH60_SPHYA|nr:3-hydroxyacyl-CoA dehydrogenase NAD-binding domain-containing protein [Sphingobium yanoikuyae]QNG48709.1 enoyl-CoA hydratase/isomerase family protein [Sphingobium yanoikuyae]